MRLRVRRITLLFRAATSAKLAAMVSLMAALALGQSPLEQGQRALDGGDFYFAYPILKPLADAGNTDAQEAMGELCDGGVPRVPTKNPDKPIYCSDAQSAHWYKLAAQKGSAKAQCKLGMNLSIYQKKDTEAFKWMLSSAEQGLPDCMCDVGNYYENGEGGVDHNFSDAFKWYSSAVFKGQACHYDLGRLYLLGRGVHKDYSLAMINLVRATEDKSRRAQAALLLGLIYQEGGDDIKQDYAEAAKWYKEAINAHPFSWAQFAQTKARIDLGDLYLEGKGVLQDYAEAMKLFKGAAETGDSEAQQRVGRLYEEGQGAPQDKKEATKWYRLAADEGEPQAQARMGAAYQFGDGVPQDYVLAHMWFNLASAGNMPATGSFAGDARDALAHHMTADQIAEAQRLAREWKPKKEPSKKP